MLIDRFETPFNRGKSRILSLPLIVMFLFVINQCVKTIVDDYKMVHENIEKIFIVTGSLVILLYLVFVLSYLFYHMWIFAFSIEIFEEYFVAFNAFGKQVKLFGYTEVTKICRPFLKITSNMKIETTTGSIEIWEGMNRYGECIESIRARSKNIEEVNYSGLDKSIIWTRNNDKFEGQR